MGRAPGLVQVWMRFCVFYLLELSCVFPAIVSELCEQQRLTCAVCTHNQTHRQIQKGQHWLLAFSRTKSATNVESPKCKILMQSLFINRTFRSARVWASFSLASCSAVDGGGESALNPPFRGGARPANVRRRFAHDLSFSNSKSCSSTSRRRSPSRSRTCVRQTIQWVSGAELECETC